MSYVKIKYREFISLDNFRVYGYVFLIFKLYFIQRFSKNRSEKNVDYLSKEEIVLTQIDYIKYYPSFKDRMIVRLCNHRYQVKAISPINNLIFIEGDSNLGFNHINLKHGFWADKFFNDKGKLVDKSKYSKEIIPITHYAIIADSLYKHENINVDSNTNKERFILYQGNVELEGIECEYRMILYKGTRIIHNMYPLKNARKSLLKSHLRCDSTATILYGESKEISFFTNFKNKNNIVDIVVIHVFDFNMRRIYIRIKDSRLDTEVSISDKPMKDNLDFYKLRNEIGINLRYIGYDTNNYFDEIVYNYLTKGQGKI